jgi:hypothetical protein
MWVSIISIFFLLLSLLDVHPKSNHIYSYLHIKCFQDIFPQCTYLDKILSELYHYCILVFLEKRLNFHQGQGAYKTQSALFLSVSAEQCVRNICIAREKKIDSVCAPRRPAEAMR